MRQLRALWLRIADRFVRGRRERDLSVEIDSHLAMHIDDNIRTGMSVDEARRQALVALGGVEPMKEHYRDRRGLPLIDSFIQDLRFGWRMLARNPGFAAVALAALAIGIGANIAIFSLANAILLRPLPIADPNHVVRAYTFAHGNTPFGEYLEYRDGNRTLVGLAAFQGLSVSMRDGETPEHVSGMAVSGNYFDTLGVRVARGRAIDRSDDRVDAPGAMVLSDRFWSRRFASNPDVIGRLLILNGQAYVVVGIAAPTFTGTMAPYAPELWTPWNGPGMVPPVENGVGGSTSGRSAHMIGRLKPGVTVEQAQADLSALASGIAQRSPETRRDLTVTVSPARTLHAEFSPAATAFVSLLMAIVGLVLLIACVNIANLMLARSAARRREIGVRLALGAGRMRLIRQLLTESALLAAMGTALGFALAWLIARAVSALELPTPIPMTLGLTFDWRVVAFATGMTIFTTMMFGLVPAWQSSKAAVTPSLKEGAPGSGLGRSRLRSTLITAQVALSTLLLVTGAVLARGMATAHAIDRGFAGSHVLAATLDLEASGYTRERGSAFLEDVLQQLERTPGVEAANLVSIVPLTLSNNQSRFVKEGNSDAENRTPLVYFNQVTKGHFATLGIPLLAGRDFDATDRRGMPDVGIVNETLARLYWPGESPIGKRLHAHVGPDDQFGPWIEVVGLARNSKYVTVGEDPAPFLYRPLAQEYTPEVTLLVRTSSEPMASLPNVRASVRAIDAELPLYNVSPLDAVTALSLLPVQVAAIVSGSLGAVALLLAAIGLYGVMSYLVRQRTTEIGTRIALGARSGDVIRVIVRQGMRWTWYGLALGLAMAWMATRLVTSLLYGVQATDTVAFAGITLVLAATAYLACYVPARRASRLDPMIALRHE